MMRRRKALIVGGTSGLGLTIALELQKFNYEEIYILGRTEPRIKTNDSIMFIRFNLLSDDYSVFNKFQDIDTLIFAAGFGRISPFEDLIESEIINNFKVNTIAVVRVIKTFYEKLKGSNPFYCTVIGSIAGLVSSPLFSTYGASKAAVVKFIESINIELEMSESSNKILNVSPGSLEGTEFHGGETDVVLNQKVANEIISHMLKRRTLFIPRFEEVYKGVMEQYQEDPTKFGLQSYQYKEKG